MGVRRIKDMVTVFSLKLIWHIFEEADSLWIVWVEHYLIRDISFWDVKVRSAGSWVWNRLLKLRPIAQNFLRMEMHNGNSIRFWSDLWHLMGRLIEVIGERRIFKLGIPRCARVRDVIYDNEWCSRHCRDQNLH